MRLPSPGRYSARWVPLVMVVILLPTRALGLQQHDQCGYSPAPHLLREPHP
jgi:hypothetical protein